LTWAPGNIPLAMIEGAREGRDTLKLKEHMFKATDLDDPI